MYRIFFTILTVILIIASSCIMYAKPKMHNNVMIYSSEYKIITEVQPPKTEQVSKKIEEIQIPARVTTEKAVAVKTNTINPTVKEVKKATTIKTEKQTEQKLSEKVSTKPIQTVQKPVQVQPPIQKQEVKQKEIISEKTKEETEEIQWNIWRSNLQNQIMRDVKLPYIKEGTIFRFSFDVDKFGKISNVQTWSTDPIYTAYAIQYIAPVIKSYQGHEILNFPAGSNRVITTAKGAWRISKTLRYSTPNDFNDTEKIRK